MSEEPRRQTPAARSLFEPHPERLPLDHPDRPAILAAHRAAVEAGEPGDVERIVEVPTGRVEQHDLLPAEGDDLQVARGGGVDDADLRAAAEEAAK